LQVLLPAVLVASGFFIIVILLAVKAQMRKHYSGTEAMIEGQGEAQTAIDGEGKVFFRVNTGRPKVISLFRRVQK